MKPIWVIGGFGIAAVIALGLAARHDVLMRHKAESIYTQKHCRSVGYDRSTPVYKCDDGMRLGTLQLDAQ